MTQEGRPGAKRPENPLDHEEDLFSHFIDEHRYTADQMSDAYHRLVGVNDEEAPAPEVSAILEKMRGMDSRGFSFNRFARLIEGKQNFEDAIPAFHTYVDSLDISTNEKKVLKSIVDEERSGDVICHLESEDVDDKGEDIDSFRIDFKDLEKTVAAIMLVQNLKAIMEKIPKERKYQFVFFEK